MSHPLAVISKNKYSSSKPQSAVLRMPDLPLPTPPPMANIMVTSRMGYRRLLNTRSNDFRSSRSHSMVDFGGVAPKWTPGERYQRANTAEFMSPILARAYLYHRGAGEIIAPNHHRQTALTEQLGLSPLPRHRNFENTSHRLEDFKEYPLYPDLYNRKIPDFVSKQHESKYLLKDSLVSNELEEVRVLNKELQKKYCSRNVIEENISRILEETSPEYCNVHYMSDIDENEEIREFMCGYKERRHSDQSDGLGFYSLPSSKRCSKKAILKPKCRTPPSGQINCLVSSSGDSASSIKSSDYYAFAAVKKVEFAGDSTGKVIKNPQRTVIKLAKIRYQLHFLSI
ncbi:hypothetical protein ABEB36_003201 [Hypothenemus hampei]|uniref:Uncharacterized protein n=1 Tax=Hypothenemus hampei TaxID=57062 RepID=A0ABD1F8S2_HYPHA